MNTRTRAVIAAASAGLVGLSLAACSTTDDIVETETPTTEPTASETSTPAETADGTTDASDSGYTDGTYTADGTYTSPGGTETISVTLTLADGVVTDVAVDNSATTNPNSLRYQGEFISGIAAEVVGVPIDEIDVDRVGGSSLTSEGFDAAVATIRAEAAA